MLPLLERMNFDEGLKRRFAKAYSLRALGELFGDLLEYLGPTLVSPALEIQYFNREDATREGHEPLQTVKFDFDAELLAASVHDSLDWWCGYRNNQGPPTGSGLVACRNCEFRETCQHYDGQTRNLPPNW